MQTHNYYVDFLKAFNAFIQKVFYQKPIQKIEYNIGSKTLLKHKLYNNENYEYPNAIIDLQDIRIAEGVSSISRNAYGLIPSLETSVPAINYTKMEKIVVDTQRYLLNFNIQINVESNADLFNFYHALTNSMPLNFTFVDFKYYYFVNITDIVSNWDFENEDVNNIIKMPDPTERDKIKYFTAIPVQPQLEIESINRNEDKENNRYYITFNVLAATQIPTQIYGTGHDLIKRIIINIDFNDPTQYPILLDIDENNYKRVKNSIKLNRDFFEPIYLIKDSNNPQDETEEVYKEEIGYQIKIDGKLDTKLFELQLNSDVIDINSTNIFIPLEPKDNENNKESGIEIEYDDKNNITIIKILNPEYKIIKNYFEKFNSEQYNNQFELIQLLLC